jgi:hypothetical protein
MLPMHLIIVSAHRNFTRTLSLEAIACIEPQCIHTFEVFDSRIHCLRAVSQVAPNGRIVVQVHRIVSGMCGLDSPGDPIHTIQAH